MNTDEEVRSIFIDLAHYDRAVTNLYDFRPLWISFLGD